MSKKMERNITFEFNPDKYTIGVFFNIGEKTYGNALMDFDNLDEKTIDEKAKILIKQIKNTIRHKKDENT